MYYKKIQRMKRQQFCFGSAINFEDMDFEETKKNMGEIECLLFISGKLNNFVNVRSYGEDLLSYLLSNRQSTHGGNATKSMWVKVQSSKSNPWYGQGKYSKIQYIVYGRIC